MSRAVERMVVNTDAGAYSAADLICCLYLLDTPNNTRRLRLNCFSISCLSALCSDFRVLCLITLAAMLIHIKNQDSGMNL